MSEESLERGYRRLLAAYPRAFRAEQGEEILAVLMSGAQQGQRRPRLAEAADLIRSAVRMRLWPQRSGPERRDLADGLAAFSLLAPLFLLAADILMVALPYRLPASPLLVATFGPHREIGGLSLLRLHFFDVAVGFELLIAVLVLLGLRGLALLAIPASAVFFAASSWWIPWMPYPLQLITAGVLLVEVAALIASPGPCHRGRPGGCGHAGLAGSAGTRPRERSSAVPTTPSTNSTGGTKSTARLPGAGWPSRLLLKTEKASCMA